VAVLRPLELQLEVFLGNIRCLNNDKGWTQINHNRDNRISAYVRWLFFMWAEFQVFLFLLIIVSCSRHPIFSDVSSTLAGNNWDCKHCGRSPLRRAHYWMEFQTEMSSRRGFGPQRPCWPDRPLDPRRNDSWLCFLVGWMGKISSLKSSVLRTLLCKVLNDILRGKHFVKVFHIKQRT